MIHFVEVAMHRLTQSLYKKEDSNAADIGIFDKSFTVIS